MRVRKYAHVTPIVETLHWLPVGTIDYKISLPPAHQCLYGNAPAYQKELLITQPTSLRSPEPSCTTVDYFKHSLKTDLLTKAFFQPIVLFCYLCFYDFNQRCCFPFLRGNQARGYYIFTERVSLSPVLSTIDHLFQLHARSSGRPEFIFHLSVKQRTGVKIPRAELSAGCYRS